MFTVVYEGLGGPNSMPLGTRCIVEYQSENDFETKKSPFLKVVAKEVSKEEARQLCDEVSGKTLARAAFESSLNEGNPDMHLFNYRLAAQSSGKGEEFEKEIQHIFLTAMQLFR